MALILIFVSALFASIQNIFMRKSVDTGGSTIVYVPIQLAVSFFLAILLNPVRQQSFAWDPATAGVGLGMGLLLGLMMWTLGQSLKYGSSSLSFAILNSSAVLPAMLMAATFGPSLGHPYQAWNGLGSVLVVVGVFWSSWAAESFTSRWRWALFIFTATLAYVLFSSLMQWRVLLEEFGGKGHFLLPFILDNSKSQWFMPSIFFSATAIQVLVMCRERSWSFSWQTLLFGILGGLSNGISMFFMILATEMATGWQNAVLWPVFSITIIEICNLWGMYSYSEEVKWLPNALCVAGIVIGSIQWGLFS